ncbi:MAG: hypothetical protein U0324_46205 [Polyangiales bacterium]
MRARVASRAAVLAASLRPANDQGAALRSALRHTTTRREPHTFEEITTS